jgi:hypothetical protein
MKNCSALHSVYSCCRYNASDEKQCFAKAHNADSIAC